MSKSNYNFLQNLFPAYEMVYSESGDSVEIINPLGKDSITVDIETYTPLDNGEDTPVYGFTQYTCSFSFQHRHYESEEDVTQYISDIINRKVYAIEFFKDGKNRFGGDITTHELSELSYEFLEQRSGYYGSTKLKDIADSFKVRGWDPRDNFDATFECDDNGKVLIVNKKENTYER